MSTAWTASTAIATGAVVEPTVVTGNGLVFRATNAGTTGTTQPIWPTTFGGTVTDGTVTWRAVSQVTGEFQGLQPSSIIELFELQLTAALHGSNDVYRFHAGANANNNGDVVWAGNTYQRFPIEADGFEYGGQGQLPRPKVRVSNVFGTITAVLATLPSGLERAKVTRIRTLARYLDAANFPGSVNPFGTPDPSAEFPREIYYIDRKTTENRDVIEFELAAAFDLQGVRAPKRQCVANICPWVYRSAECGYTELSYYKSDDTPVASASEDVCGKRLSSCEIRFAPQRLLGSVTVGSNILTLDAAASLFPAGVPISGFAIPAGTTVVSTSGNLVTMSASATATSTFTKTGTLQSNRTQIVLSNVTGLTVGMTISGPKIPTGAVVTAISGNTITLGQPVSLLDVLSLSFTRSGSLWAANTAYQTGTSNYLLLDSITGVNVGMYVIGPAIELAQVTGFSSTTAGTVVALSYSGIVSGSSGNYSFYTQQAQTLQTYTFQATSRVYSFRADNGISFGGFPGIGAYYT